MDLRGLLLREGWEGKGEGLRSGEGVGRGRGREGGRGREREGPHGTCLHPPDMKS